MRKTCILVIDDEEDILKTIAMALKLEGFEVVTAVDGEDGFNKACAIKPELIISDVMLPSMTGYEICSKLKADKRYKTIPLILITVQAQASYKIQGKKAGADFFLVKPFEMDVLVNKVKEFLEFKNN